MAKKKKKFQETTIEDYYDLKVDKVEELVAALKGDIDEDEIENTSFDMTESVGFDDPSHYKKSGKRREFDPYKVDKFSFIPYWVKALFIKFWFAGAVCYFVMMGLGIDVKSTLDMTVLVGIVLGIITDMFVNPIFRYMESDRREYNDFMMFPFPFRQFWTFFTNMIYYILVSFVVCELYYVINLVTFVGVEPLLFGLFTLVVDMAFIGIKDGIVRLIKHLKNKKREGKVNA